MLNAFYERKGRRSLDDFERRITKHLQPYFGASRRLATITSADIDKYIVKRQADTIRTRNDDWEVRGHDKGLCRRTAQAGLTHADQPRTSGTASDVLSGCEERQADGAAVY